MLRSMEEHVCVCKLFMHRHHLIAPAFLAAFINKVSLATIIIKKNWQHVSLSIDKEYCQTRSLVLFLFPLSLSRSLRYLIS